MPLEWLLAAAAVLAGTVLQGSLGFGVALVAAPLLYLIDPMLVPVPVILVGLAVSLLVLWRDRAAVDRRAIGRVLPGLLLGVLAAGPVMRAVSADTLGLLFGALVLLAVALSIGRPPPTPGHRLLFAAGALAGFMGTTTSIGGPPLALAFQDRRGPHLRATLSACFVSIGVFALATLHWAGHLTPERVLAGLSLVPPVVLGVAISARTARALDREWLRTGVLAVSALAALAAIVRSLV